MVPEFEQGIEFASKFENGNLKKAIRLSLTEYNIVLDEDFNTKGHIQWYYFKTITKNIPPSKLIDIILYSRNYNPI